MSFRKTKWMPWRNYAKHIEPLYLQLRSQAVTQSNKYVEQGDAKAESNSSFFLISLSEDWVVHFIPFKAAFHI